MQAAVFAQEGPTAGALLRTTFAITRQQFGPLAVIAAIGAAPATLMLLSSALITNQSQIGTALLVMLLSMVAMCISIPIAYGATMVAVYRAAMGQRIDVGQCLLTSVRRLPQMILTGILYILAVFVGFLLLIIPGVIAYYAFLLALPVVMLEDKGPIEAMKRSRHLTEGYRLSAFGALLVIILISMPLSILGALFAKNLPVYVVLTLASNLISYLLSFVLVGVFYFGVRSYKESLGADEVAAVFD